MALDEMLAQVLGSVFGQAISQSPSPYVRMNRAYKACFESASASGDWSNRALVQALKDRSVPGAYAEFTGSLAERALAAWEARTDPRDLKRESRRWRDGIRRRS